MNIIVGSSAAPDQGSGIGNYAKELSEALVALGHSIHYLSPPPKDYSWLTQCKANHVTSDQYDDPLQRCQELVHYINANAISAAINNDNPFLQSIAPALGCPMISIGHMDRKSIAALACFGWHWIDYIVAISKDMRRVFMKKYKVPRDKCPIIYNGAQDRFNAHVKPNYQSRLRVIYSGGYSRNKGASKILGLLQKNQSLQGMIELHWFGDCHERIRTKLSQFQCVKFHGRVSRDSFLNCLMKSDILLLPSQFEGCPMVLIEALSFGVVPISSDGHGAMRSIIHHDTDGYICNLSNWHYQSSHFLRALNQNREKLFMMKKAARHNFTTTLDIHVVAHKILNLIHNPTVDRQNRPESFDILRWHRPLRPDGLKAPLIDRFCIYFAILRKEGVVTTPLA